MSVRAYFIRLFCLAMLCLSPGCQLHDLGKKIHEWQNKDRGEEGDPPAVAGVVAVPTPDPDPGDQMRRTLYKFDPREGCDANRTKIWPACHRSFGGGSVADIARSLVGRPPPPPDLATLPPTSMLRRCLEQGEALVEKYCPPPPLEGEAPEPARR